MWQNCTSYITHWETALFSLLFRYSDKFWRLKTMFWNSSDSSFFEISELFRLISFLSNFNGFPGTFDIWDSFHQLYGSFIAHLSVGSYVWLDGISFIHEREKFMCMKSEQETIIVFKNLYSTRVSLVGWRKLGNLNNLSKYEVVNYSRAVWLTCFTSFREPYTFPSDDIYVFVPVFSCNIVTRRRKENMGFGCFSKFG